MNEILELNEINQDDEQREELKKEADRGYPECEKMQKVAPQSAVVGEFLDWLQNKKDLVICEWHEEEVDGEDEGYYPYHCSIEQWLADFFEIDLKKVEEEQRQMLEDIRKKDETKVQRSQSTNNSP